MNAHRRKLVLTAASLAAAFFVLFFSRSPADAAKEGGALKPSDPAGALVGSATCSGRGCHGAGAPASSAGPRGDEFTKFLSEDRHADAYRVLFNERSVRIAKNLKTTAHEDLRCLACHTTPAATASKNAHDQWIGCESCHGSAKSWLSEHTSAAWRNDPKQKSASGLVDLSNLAVRASTCVGCHVGSPPDEKNGVPLRDVNHDLIAAGHPRLRFEFSAFQANMAHHWRKKPSDDENLRLWVVGQAASAQAALDLLAYRSGASTQPWPEFTEYDCFACHHGLNDPSWRQGRGYRSGERPGNYPWGAWYYPLVPDGLSLVGGTPGAEYGKSIGELKTLMGRPFPDRKKAAEHARSAAALLRPLVDLAAQSPLNSEKVVEWKKRLEGEGPAWEWESAAQRWLALAALAADARDPEAIKRIEAARAELEFPVDYDSPRDFRNRPAKK